MADAQKRSGMSYQQHGVEASLDTKQLASVGGSMDSVISSDTMSPCENDMPGSSLDVNKSVLRCLALVLSPRFPARQPFLWIPCMTPLENSSTVRTQSNGWKSDQRRQRDVAQAGNTSYSPRKRRKQQTNKAKRSCIFEDTFWEDLLKARCW